MHGFPRPRRPSSGPLTALLLLLLATGCFEDRARPLPVEPNQPVRLIAQILAPRTGLTVGTERDVTVSVTARDLDGRSLTGVGFVVRRFAPGNPALDSAAVLFPARADSTHAFTFRVPAGLPTNTQLDVYGIAYGVGGGTQLSVASFLVVLNCSTTPCPGL
jgi:hypothetical protein